MIADMLYRQARSVATALAYVVATAVWVYAGVEQQRDALEWPWFDWPRIIVAVVVLHFAVGILIGRLWALALPLGAVLVAVPAGDFPGGYPEVPVWIWLAFTLFWAGVPALLAGMAVRAAARRRRAAVPSG
jgi:hypothetical protein